MKGSIVRYDWNTIYRFNEYNEAIAYANENMGIDGVKEKAEKLTAEKEAYVQSVKRVEETEKPNEDKEYLGWKKFYSNKTIFKRITIGLVIFYVLFLNGHAGIMKTVFAISIVAMFSAFVVMKIGEYIHRGNYESYVKQIQGSILIHNNNFAEKSRKCYAEIDDLYLLSLDSAHREIVMMRRDQAKQHEEKMRIERERLRIQEEARQEAQRARRAQERLLQIEEEREKRYR